VIIGTGCDLVPVDRLREACLRHPPMLERLFSPRERGEAELRGVRRWERLAGVFAAKEAALKALGTGMRVAFRDVEVDHDAAGRPLLRLGGEAGAVAARLGAGRVHVSISHSGGFAIATVIAEGGVD
jgi:holo-[acyl-carrier protein] synthase